MCRGVKMDGNVCMWMYEEVLMCRGEVDVSVDVCEYIWMYGCMHVWMWSGICVCGCVYMCMHVWM